MRTRPDGVLAPDLTDITRPTHHAPARTLTNATGLRRALIVVGAVGGSAALCGPAVLALARIDLTSVLIIAATLAIATILAHRAGRRRAKETTTMTTPHYRPPRPQLYRVRLFDGRYELLRRRLYQVSVDLDDAQHSGAVLRQMLSSLVIEAQAAREYVTSPRLELYNAAGDKVLDVAP